MSAEGLTRHQYQIVTGLFGLALTLVVFNIFLARGNQTVQTEVAARQQYVQQTVQVKNAAKQLVQLLANRSAQTGDEEIRRMLSSFGIEFRINRPQPAPGSTAADPFDEVLP